MAQITVHALLFALLGSTAAAQPASVTEGDSPEGQATGTDHAFDGPEGSSRKLEDEREQESIYAFDNFQRWASPYFDWKKELEREHGLSFGFSAYLLFQNSSESLSGRDDGAGGIYRFQGSWKAFARDTRHPGRLEWRVENRSAMGGSMAPSALSSDAGAAALNTAFGYSDGFDTDLAVLSWVQAFNDQRAGIAVGRLAFDVYQDAFLFQTFSRGFLNRAFLVNPTIGTTGVGALGAVAKGFVTDSVWVGGQAHDGNAVSGEFDIDTVEEGEWLKSVEIGWTPSIDRYKTDRIQLTLWDKDARGQASVPGGQGWAVSTSFKLSDRLIPFARFGHSDGGAGVVATSAFSAGLEYSLRKDQAISVGAGWARPSGETFGPGLDDEYVIETSYKVQLSPNFSVMPDLQLLLNPASNPTKDSVWILGLRAIMSF